MKQKLAIVSGGILLLMITALLTIPKGTRTSDTEQVQQDPARFDVGIPTAQEIRNMLAVYGKRVESTEHQLKALRQELTDAKDHATEARKRNTSALERLMEELRTVSSPQTDPAPKAGPRFRTYEFETKERQAVHIPAGSFGEATLLSGVFAPTTGDPLPVLLRLDAALVGPGRSRVPLSGAFLVGKAQGDASSGRAIVQLETLSAVREDGATFEISVNGWAVDDDGIQGLRGEYVWHADEIIGLAAVSGALSGGAEAVAEREMLVQTTPLGGLQSAVTGDPVRFAGARAASTAFERIGDAVSKRLDEIVPAIHVPNARRVTVAFISGATLEGWAPPETESSPFEGLDR